MYAMTYEQSMSITDELAYINIPVSILKYCIKNISRSALVLWEELRDITKYKDKWKTTITNKHLGQRIGRSAHTAYVLMKELVSNGLAIKNYQLGKACTIMLRYPLALLDHAVFKSNTPFKNKGGKTTSSLYINNNYVNNQEEKIMKDPDKWPEIKQNCLNKIKECTETLKRLKTEFNSQPHMMQPNETARSYQKRYLALPRETHLKDQEMMKVINKLEEYLNSRFVDLNKVNALLEEGKEAYLKRTNKNIVKKPYQPYNTKKFTPKPVGKPPVTRYNPPPYKKYRDEYDY